MRSGTFNICLCGDHITGALAARLKWSVRWRLQGGAGKSSLWEYRARGVAVRVIQGDTCKVPRTVPDA